MKNRELPSSIEEIAWRKEFPRRRRSRSYRGAEIPPEEVIGGGAAAAGGGGRRESVGGGRKA